MKNINYICKLKNPVKMNVKQIYGNVDIPSFLPLSLLKNHQ